MDNGYPIHMEGLEDQGYRQPSFVDISTCGCINIKCLTVFLTLICCFASAVILCCLHCMHKGTYKCIVIITFTHTI